MPANPVLRALRKAFRSFESERTDEPPTSQWSFTVQLEEDELDGGWIASVAELPGCMSQGETEAEAVENLADAFGGVLEARMRASLGNSIEFGEAHVQRGPRQSHRHRVAI